MRVVREISKLIMFTIIWGIPVLTAKMFDSTNFLFLFIVSMFGTLFIFGHFEDLEKTDQIVEATAHLSANIDIDKAIIDSAKTKIDLNE